MMRVPAEDLTFSNGIFGAQLLGAKGHDYRFVPSWGSKEMPLTKDGPRKDEAGSQDPDDTRHSCESTQSRAPDHNS